MGESGKKSCAGEAEQFVMRAQQFEGADGIGAFPGEGRAFFTAQRFGKNEQAIHGVEEAERGGDPKWKARTDVSEQSANGWADNESQTESSAEQAKGFGAFFFGCDIGNVGARSGNAGGGDARDDAS